MITLRRRHERGHFDHGWLDTYHTLSFADYRDPRYMGFRALRVINEDRVRPGEGFGRHGHRDMEILTYVLSGELEHGDSLGNRGVIRPGLIQYMAAGTGVEHSEFNPSPTTPVHLIQIWLRPNRRGVPPRYEQRQFPSLAEEPGQRPGRFENAPATGRARPGGAAPGADDAALTLLASPDGRDGSIQINQDAAVYAGTLAAGQSVWREIGDGRGVWVQVMRGRIRLDGQQLEAGDGAAVDEQRELTIVADEQAELLVFDLA